MLEELYTLDLSMRLGIFFVCNVFLVLWSRCIVVPAGIGWKRFSLCLPVFCTNLLVASLFNFDHPTERVLSFYILAAYLFIGSLKEFALCLNRGQVTKVLDSNSMAAVTVALLLLVNIALEVKPIDSSKKTDSGGKVYRKQTVFEDVEFCLIKFEPGAWLKEVGSIAVSLCTKALIWYLLALASSQTTDYSFFQSFVYSFFFFFHVATIAGLTELTSLAVFNIKLSSAFDRPYLARSVTSFWSKKWNLVIQQVLKDVFFDCVAEGTLIAGKQWTGKPRPSPGRLVWGMINVFFVSALMHGLFIMKAMNTTDFPVLFATFFLVNALVVFLEKLMRIAIKRIGVYTQSPSLMVSAVLLLYTQTLNVILSHYFFWPDVVRMQYMPDLVDGVIHLGNLFK